MKRTILTLTLCFALAGTLSAQQTATTEPAAAPATGTTAVTETAAATTPVDSTSPSSYELRNQFATLLRQHPPEVAMLLKLDPALLSNEQFIASYPELTRFLATHPEIRRNPHFYLEEFPGPGRNNDLFREIIEGLYIFAILCFFAFLFSWLVRTLVEQRRWSRLSRTQSEVHTKILDRFGTSTELIEYMRTPAGTKFLESAPIPLQSEQTLQSAPLSRMLWSVQVGVVVVAAAIGLLIVSNRFDAETSQGLFAMGVIALCVGGGFIASAVISLVLSRRLGLWRGPASEAATLPDA